MTSIAEAMRNLDAALADNVKLKVDAANWRIRAKQAELKIADLESRLKFSDDTASELMRMVDGLRAERDTWRAAAGR